MSLKQRLREQLERSRDFSERLLAAFHTPAEWLHQVHPRANHPLWFAGHMGVVDDFMLSLVAPERALARADFQERFGMGSQPSADPNDYPPVDQVLAFMRERRQALLAALDSLDESQLNHPTPKGAPSFLPDYASAFQTAAWHEGLHTGQMTVVHRALGNPPLVGG